MRDREILTPEEVLERYTSGPKTGVFTDGSCEGNPGPGSWAFVWVENDRIVDQNSGVAASTTNNRMELRALIEAYRALPEDHEIIVYSGDTSHTYAVTEVLILPEAGQPLEVRIENAHYVLPTDDERLTLVTCHPYGSLQNRLIVFAYPNNE